MELQLKRRPRLELELKRRPRLELELKRRPRMELELKRRPQLELELKRRPRLELERSSLVQVQKYSVKLNNYVLSFECTIVHAILVALLLVHNTMEAINRMLSNI